MWWKDILTTHPSKGNRLQNEQPSKTSPSKSPTPKKIQSKNKTAKKNKKQNKIRNKSKEIKTKGIKNHLYNTTPKPRKEKKSLNNIPTLPQNVSRKKTEELR